MIMVDLSTAERNQPAMIELIDVSAVSFVCVMPMPARALVPQPLRCVLCALV